MSLYDIFMFYDRKMISFVDKVLYFYFLHFQCYSMSSHLLSYTCLLSGYSLLAKEGVRATGA